MHKFFFWNDLYLNVCRGVFRNQPNIYSAASLRKSQKHFVVDVLLGSQNAPVVSFTEQKVYMMSLFVKYRRSQL